MIKITEYVCKRRVFERRTFMRSLKMHHWQWLCINLVYCTVYFYVVKLISRGDIYLNDIWFSSITLEKLGKMTPALKNSICDTLTPFIHEHTVNTFFPSCLQSLLVFSIANKSAFREAECNTFTKTLPAEFCGINCRPTHISTLTVNMGRLFSDEAKPWLLEERHT